MNTNLKEIILMGGGSERDKKMKYKSHPIRPIESTLEKRA